MEEGHLAIQDEIKCSTRKHLAPYGLGEVELRHEGWKLDAAGTLYVSLIKYSGSGDFFTSISRHHWGQEKYSREEQIQKCVGKGPR